MKRAEVQKACVTARALSVIPRRVDAEGPLIRSRVHTNLAEGVSAMVGAGLWGLGRGGDSCFTQNLCSVRGSLAVSAARDDRLRGPGWTRPALNQLVIVTGVPVLTDLKKFSAMNSGMRMHPCDAGYPGK